VALDAPCRDESRREELVLERAAAVRDGAEPADSHDEALLAPREHAEQVPAEADAQVFVRS
jgi:hypothetical protein